MTDEKHKSKQSPEKTGSAGSQTGQGVNTEEVVKLLAEILQKTKERVEPEIPDAVAQAITQFEEIDFALRVPTQAKRNIDKPKWELPLLNPRTIRPGEKETE